MAFSKLTFSQNWTSGVPLVLSIEYLMALTRKASSWAAHKRLSFSRLSSPRFSHAHLFLSSVLSVSLKSWPWRVFLFHSIRRCFVPSYLFWTFINFLSFSSVVAAMIRFSLLLQAYSAKSSLWLLIQSSMVKSPLLPSLLGRYNHSTFDLGCIPPHMVIIFLVFRSISFTSSFIHSIISPLYLKVGVTHVFIVGTHALHLISIWMSLSTS